MVGIISYGVHIPRWRLSKKSINQAWRRPGGSGERSIANFDEDSITMAVSSGLACLGNARFSEKQVAGLYMATTTPPYREKSSAAVVATALDLRSDILTIDYGFSLKASTAALLSAFDRVKAGSKGALMVAASDCRLAEPGTLLEPNLGDASASVLVGESDSIACLIDAYSLSEDILDLWRRDADTFVRQDDVRFAQIYGFEKNVAEAISGLLAKTGMRPGDFTKVIIPPVDARSHLKLASRLGFDAKNQLQQVLPDVGLCGTALPLFLLATALEEASAGDRILLASYGDGADAMAFEVRQGIETLKTRGSIHRQHGAKRVMSNYNQYLSFNHLIKGQEPLTLPFSSTSMAYREKQSNMKLYARQCQGCKRTVFLRDIHVCPECYAQDRFEWKKLSKEAALFTFNQEYYYPSPDPPTTMAVVDFPEGARLTTQMTDVDPSDVKIGMPLEICFRKFHEGNFFHNYFWKCRPTLG
ncbi:MAG: OB-fold domain-containing protein [Pseudomonadota bacterium]